jgi:hypothetical protein
MSVFEAAGMLRDDMSLRDVRRRGEHESRAESA